MGHVKKEPSVKIDPSGSFKLVSKSEVMGADTTTSLMLRTALQRRSLAFDQCRLIGYVEHERWVNYLFSQLGHIPPPGYSAVSIEQILQADVEMWNLLAQECRSGLAATANGSLPVEQAMAKVMYSPQITYAMLPLPHGKAPSADKGKRRRESDEDDKPNKRSKGGKGKGKNSDKASSGKGSEKLSRNQAKNRAAEVFDSIPELKSMWSTIKGKPLCARYQLGSCPESSGVTPGGTCTKGLHACCVPKCFQTHSMKEHPK
jgi:hypothetical protein